jgi:hypothetical protein
MTLQVLAGDDFSGMFEQNREDLERLSLDPDTDALAAEFPSLQIDFEDPEPNTRLCFNRLRHGEPKIKPPKYLSFGRSGAGSGSKLLETF